MSGIGWEWNGRHCASLSTVGKTPALLPAMASPPPQPDHRPVPEPLAGFIATELARAIERGEYPPGSRLAEAEIAARFGVSRAPVREALRMLMTDDRVVRRPRRGTIVPELTPDELSEMFEIRSALYAALVRHFTRHATPARLETFASLSDQLDNLARDPATTPAVMVDATQRHSRFVVESCGNARLRAAFVKLTRQSYRFYAELAHTTAEHRRRIAALGLELLSAVRSGDAEAAAAIAWRLSEANHHAARAALAERPPQPPR